MYNNLEVKRGEIWFVGLDGKGSEQKGLRPVLIIQNDIGNKFSPTTIIASITSQITKAKLPTHVEVEGYGLDSKSVILLEQIRAIDKRERLVKYIGRLDDYMMEKVENALCVSLKIGDTRKEKIAKEKALEVRQLDLLLSRLVKYNIDSKDFTDTLKERELYLNDLIGFCESNKLNYREFYSMSGEESRKIAV
jgi:mRNA interferase MazF